MSGNSFLNTLFGLIPLLPLSAAFAEPLSLGSLQAIEQIVKKDASLLETFFVGEELLDEIAGKKEGVEFLSEIENQGWFGDNDSQSQFWKTARNIHLSSQQKAESLKAIIERFKENQSFSLWKAQQSFMQSREKPSHYAACSTSSVGKEVFGLLLPTPFQDAKDAYCSQELATRCMKDGAIVMYGSARIQPGEHGYHHAQRLAELIMGSQKLQPVSIVTGGGPGLMAAANIGALAGLANLEAGKSTGHSVGLATYFPKGNETIEVDNFTKWQSEDGQAKFCGYMAASFAQRQADMAEHASAHVYNRGGTGTEWEIYEVLSKIESGLIRAGSPIVFLAEDDASATSLQNEWGSMLRRLENISERSPSLNFLKDLRESKVGMTMDFMGHAILLTNQPEIAAEFLETHLFDKDLLTTRTQKANKNDLQATPEEIESDSLAYLKLLREITGRPEKNYQLNHPKSGETITIKETRERTISIVASKQELSDKADNIHIQAMRDIQGLLVEFAKRLPESSVPVNKYPIATSGIGPMVLPVHTQLSMQGLPSLTLEKPGKSLSPLGSKMASKKPEHLKQVYIRSHSQRDAYFLERAAAIVFTPTDLESEWQIYQTFVRIQTGKIPMDRIPIFFMTSPVREKHDVLWGSLERRLEQMAKNNVIGPSDIDMLKKNYVTSVDELLMKLESSSSISNW